MTPNQTTFIVGNAGDSAPQARDAISVAEAAALISSGSGVSQIIAGTNVTISPSGGTGAVTINATGGGGAVASVTASGAGITASPATGAVVISNTGVTSIVAGSGITVSGGTGAVTINATGGGGTPGGTPTNLQYNLGGTFAGIASTSYTADFGLSLISTTDQVYYFLNGIAGRMNVPFRIDATTDVPFNAVAIASDTSSIAVSTNSVPLSGQTTPFNPEFNAYFGIRSATAKNGYLCIGDYGGSEKTLYLGSDGIVGRNLGYYNQIVAGNIQLLGTITTLSMVTSDYNGYLDTIKNGGGFRWLSGSAPRGAFLNDEANGRTYYYNYKSSNVMFSILDGGGVSMEASAIGFYGSTPTTQAAAIADSTDVSDTATKLNALLAAIRTLGLIAT